MPEIPNKVLFQACVSGKPLSVLKTIRELMLTPHCHIQGEVFAVDEQGNHVSGSDSRARHWTPMGAWQFVTANMPQSPMAMNIASQSYTYMDKTVEAVTNGLYTTIKEYNKIATIGQIIHIINEAISLADNKHEL